jgi:hypothetical protein
MLTFDPKTYARDVLQPLRGEKPDEFERYRLELSDDDDAAITKRLAEVNAYWRNNSTAPGTVGQVIKAMLREHNTLVGQLEAGNDRHQLRDRVQAAKAQANAAKWTTIDQALDQTYKAHSGIPDEIRDRITEIGKRVGLSEPEVQGHIADVMRVKGWKAVALAQVTGVEPLPEAKARQIHQVVRRFADTQSHETGNTSPVRSLFEALELQIDADANACTAATAGLEERLNKQVRRDSDYGAAGRNLVQQAKANLSTSDGIARYRATVVQAVKRELQPEFDSLAMDDAIDQQENAQLLRLAAAAGLPDVYAREVVNLLFKESAEAGRPVTRVEGERVEIILCAACGNPDAIGSGHNQCLQCGQPLYRECGQCHKEVPRGEAVCRYCGHSMQDAIQFDAALRDGLQALAAGRPEQASRNAAAALAIDPASIEARELATSAQAAAQRATTGWQTVREALHGRRLYAARAAVQILVAEGCDVRDGGEDPVQVQRQIADDLAAVDKRLEAARNETDDARRERLFADVLSQVADCDAAQRALSQIPPQAPSRLEAEVVDQSVHLRWAASPSPGVSGYVIVRGAQRAPIDRSHGERVGLTQGTVQVDSTVEGGLEVAYAVFAERAGSISAPATTAPLLTAFEATDVQATVGSGEVRLSWRLPNPRATVEVVRSSADGSVTLAAGGDGLVDTNVINGRVYTYRVRARYGAQTTTGVDIAATPAEPPRAVTLQSLEAVAAGVQIRWAAPQTGTVNVLRSGKAPELAPGTEIRRGDLGSLGTLFPGAGGSATDPSAVDGAWYTPVTILGDRAVLGPPLRWTDIAAITDVQIRGTGDEAAISWNWPPEVRHALVLWREGAAPEGLDDPDAHRATVSRAALKEVSGGAFRITRERPSEPLRVAVHGAQMRDGELVVGSRLVLTSRASADPNLARAMISYDVKFKGGFRGKSLEFMLNGADAFPEVVLVARPGDVMLLDAEAGQAIARLGGNGGLAAVAVPLGSLPKERPLTIRAFLATDGAKSSYALRDPADLTKLTLR